MGRTLEQHSTRASTDYSEGTTRVWAQHSPKVEVVGNFIIGTATVSYENNKVMRTHGYDLWRCALKDVMIFREYFSVNNKN